MRRTPLILVSVLAALPAFASASCFSVYSRVDKLVYQSTVNPIDLALPISQGLKPRFPGTHLVMDPDETSCTEVGAGSASSRSDPRQAAQNSMATGPLGASPVTRDSRAPMSTSVDTDYASDRASYVADPIGASRARARPAARSR